MPTALRVVRAAIAVATIVALVHQLVNGDDDPTFTTANYLSYFTVLSNLGAIIVLGSLALRPGLVVSESFTILRGAVMLYMTITGIVYNVLLDPSRPTSARTSSGST